MGNFPSQQNTPLDPRQADTPLDNNSQKTPLNPGSPQEPVSTPIPQQPLESQGIPGGQVPGNPSQELATPTQRQELMDMLEATRAKMGELQTAKFRSANEREVARVETLKQIFIMMQEAGVDLNDPASVASFLDRLRSTNQEMATMFESTLEDLLSEEMPPEDQQMGQNPPSFNEAAPSAGMPEGGLRPIPQGLPQNGNEAVPENLRGPVPPEGGGQA